MKCPICWSSMSSMRKKCPRCGIDIADVDQLVELSFGQAGSVKGGGYKLCRFCKCEINRKAKVCPVCGRDQRGTGLCGCLTTVVAASAIISFFDDRKHR